MVALKQELADLLSPYVRGSRNAVVALKPRLGCRPVPGGKRSRNAVVALKRARAGMARAESRMEAGTPWWH